MQISKQPNLACQYGDPKTGKTGDGLLSFPRAFWLASPGALKPSIGLAGYEVPAALVKNPETIADATRLMLACKDDVDAVMVDDLSVLVDRTIQKYQKTKDGFELWAAVYNDLLALREAARAMGRHVVLNCHALPPRTADGTRLKGSPALPGKQLPYKIPAACDLVLRTQPAPSNSISIGWPIFYRCDPSDAEWISGDRNNVTPDPAPMNLGEIFRLAGFPIRRLKGLEWQEDVVEKAATALVGRLAEAEHVGAVLAAVFERAVGHHKASDLHAVWTQRDAWDRAVLRTALGAHRRRLFPTK